MRASSRVGHLRRSIDNLTSPRPTRFRSNIFTRDNVDLRFARKRGRRYFGRLLRRRLADRSFTRTVRTIETAELTRNRDVFGTIELISV